MQLALPRTAGSSSRKAGVRRRGERQGDLARTKALIGAAFEVWRINNALPAQLGFRETISRDAAIAEQKRRQSVAP